MTIAELFVNLGIKGDDKATKGLEGVKKGLGDVASSGLAAKAMIIGVMYGLEKLMSNSANAGNGLQQFATFTGLSAEKLQRWQYAARQVGVSAEEVTGSVKGVQQAMTNMLLGKGAPEGLAMLANTVGFDVKKARDSFYVMEQLQKFAQKVPPDIANNVMKSFGLSEGTISAMRKNAFNTKSLATAPIYSDSETQRLQKISVAWSNLGHHIEMAIGHLTAKHGFSLVKDMSNISTQVLKMVDSFVILAEKLKLFEGISKIFEGWGMIFKGINSGLDRILGDKGGLVAGAKTEAKDDLQGLALAGRGLWETVKDQFATPSDTTSKFQNIGTQGKSTGPQNVKVEVHNHGVKDMKDGAYHVKKAVQDSLRQMSAQGQGS